MFKQFIVVEVKKVIGDATILFLNYNYNYNCAGDCASGPGQRDVAPFRIFGAQDVHFV